MASATLPASSSSRVAAGRGSRGSLLWKAMGDGSAPPSDFVNRSASIHAGKRGMRGDFLSAVISGSSSRTHPAVEQDRPSSIMVPPIALPHTQSVSQKRGIRGELLWRAISGGTGQLSARQSEVLQEGWVEMSQQGKGSAPGAWVKTWCVTMPGGRVSLFEQGAKTPTVELRGVTVLDTCETELSSPLILRVCDGHCAADGKAVQLRLESVDHKKKWLAAFRLCQGIAMPERPRERRHSLNGPQPTPSAGDAGFGMDGSGLERGVQCIKKDAESFVYDVPEPDNSRRLSLCPRRLSLRELSLSLPE